MSGRTRPAARCRALFLEVSRYLNGELTPARRRIVEQHINTCACCGTMAACLRRTVAACRAQGKRRPPRAVMLRMEKRIRALVAREGRVATKENAYESRTTARVRTASRH